MNANVKIEKFEIGPNAYVPSYEKDPKNYGRDMRDWERESKKEMRVYVHRNEETILENLCGGRRTNPAKDLKPLVIEELKKAGICVGEFKLRWSQKAGCNCGCSPGFVLVGCRIGKDAHLTFTETK